ncbi:MAG: DUF4054 domain-containing protein [Candidatus Diapherotrites archaeon]|nr:DUF4054 domain-containing protein [Candidatus Diapherotrites archaeon]
MAFTTAQFRLDFPEFADDTKYTDSMVSFWSGLGLKLISESNFDDVYDEAISLFTAHNLAIQAGNISASAGGGAVGGLSGAIGSKSVGSASISYDTASSMEPDAGHWNTTTYGKQFISLMRLYGGGGLHV